MGDTGGDYKASLGSMNTNATHDGNNSQEPFPDDVAADIAKAEKQNVDVLEAALLDLGLPPTIDRTDKPRRHVADDVTVVMVSDEGEALGVFFEGNRQYPGAFLFAFTPFWLSRQPSPSDVTMETLFVHKAITADAGGQTFLDVFRPPRRVTYIMNHVIGLTNTPVQTAGVKLTAYGLDTPMSSSHPIKLRVDDKLLTHTVCAAAGVAHPVTLGLWLPGESSPDYPDCFPSVRVVRLPSKDVSCEDIEKIVREFLDSKQMRMFEKIVVKAYGLNWYGSKGVSFHPISDVNAIVTAVLDLLNRIIPGQGILVQSFITTFDRAMTSGTGRSIASVAEKDLQCRIRVIVCRTPSDAARVTSIVCGISDINSPVNGDNTIPMSLELMLRKWGIRDVTQQKQVHDVIKQKSERLLLELLEREKRLTVVEKGGAGAELAMIGLDVVLAKVNDVITPVVIEVNGECCIEQAFVYETTVPVLQGESEYLWVQTMVSRSQRFLMQDKTVVVVGGGQFSKRSLWKDAKEFGVKILLVDSNPNHLAKDHVHRFLHVNTDDHTRDHEHADVIVKRVKSEVGHVDGCMTFWEDCVPLTSLVAEGLGMRHTPPYKSAFAAKSKLLTHSILRVEDQWQPSHAMLASLYASPVAPITKVQDLQQAISKVPLPAVLKFEFGSGSVGIRHVTTYNEAAEHVERIPKTLRTVDGLGYGESMLLMPLLVGTEHSVEVVLFEGQLTTAFVIDVGTTRPPLCLTTLAVVPSVLSDESQRQLITAAVTCCKTLGLLTGVFDVDMMLTTVGPKLLEVNARMGGLYTRDFIRTIYDVDLLHLSLMATCGMRPVASNSLVGGYSTSSTRDNSGQLIGLLLYPGRHGNALATTATPARLRSLHDQGVIKFLQFEETPDDCFSEYEEPFAAVGVHGATLEEARSKFKGTCLALGLETEASVGELLQHVCDCEN